MPYVSDAQRRFMHARHPRIAARWDRETPKGTKLPERVSQMKRHMKRRRKGTSGRR